MRHSRCILVLLTLAISSIAATRGQQRENAQQNLAMSKTVSDLERAGLRGPVRSVEEEQTYPPFTPSDGIVDPEFKSWKKTEYDRKGRITAIWGRDSSREHGLGKALYVTRYTYSDTGQLVRMTREVDGARDCETLYRYDDHGRLESITNSKDAGNPIAFHYDAQGRKTKIAIAKPIELPKGQPEYAISASAEYLFDSASSAVTLPEGGSAVTIYDEQDRPIEVQTRTANGEITFRAIRVYDEQGRITEEKQMIGDPLGMIPGAEQKKIFDTGEITPQQLRDQITQLLGGSEMQSTRYVYDAQGRKVLSTHKLFGHEEQRLETSYNEHGYVAKEIEERTTSGTPGEEHDKKSAFEKVYRYEYDDRDNWTLKQSATRELPDGTLKDSGEKVQRTIEYY